MKRYLSTILLLASTLLIGCNSGESSSGIKEQNDSTTVSRLSGVYMGSSTVDENAPRATTKCQVNWVYVYTGYTKVTFKSVGGCRFSSVRFVGTTRDRAAQNMLFAYKWKYWVWFTYSGSKVIYYAV